MGSKAETQNGTVRGCIESALSELESLRDEMQDWYDGMPEAFQNADKGERVQAAADGLETLIGNVEEAVQALDNADSAIPDDNDATPPSDIDVSYTQDTRKAQPRSTRLGNAMAMLDAAAGGLESWLSIAPMPEAAEVVEGLTEEEEAVAEADAEKIAEMYDSVREAVDALQGCDAGDVEFPGMYG